MSGKSLSSISEWDIIRKFARGQPVANRQVLCGIGDDATVLAGKKGRLLVTTDLLQEGVHFNPRWATWAQIGERALQVNLSDIAAMGGRPSHYWLSLSAPGDFALKDLAALRRGFEKAARQHGVYCVGGDTNQSPAGMTLCITLMGWAKRHVAHRHDARVGDDIYVSGYVGEAALGLLLLQKNQRAIGAAKRFIRRHQCPRARVTLGQALVQRHLAHAMIDISDGLAADLHHIAQASGVGAELWTKQIRAHPTFKAVCKATHTASELLMLTGGDDYELLFTASPRSASSLARLSKKMKLPLTRIGRIVKGKKCRFYDAAGQEISLKKLGYTHF